VLFGDKKDVEALVDLGAYPDKADDGKNPLILAAGKGQGNILEYLLDMFGGGMFAIDIDLPDNHGDTCLHAAVERCRIQESARNIVEMLVDKGAQLAKKNLANKTPLDLIFECVQCPVDFVKDLLNKRVGLNFVRSKFLFRYNFQTKILKKLKRD